MPRSRSDISNTAIRIFLQDVGRFYDEERGFEIFRPTKSQKKKVDEFFDGNCAYCGIELDTDLSTLDHLIPMNKEALGLHCWGNVVSCCRHCNKTKQHNDWLSFLENKAGSEFSARRDRILQFVKHFQYDPELGLHSIANNLYQDVGEVSMTLIRLRFKQAQENIRAIVKHE